jgi:hypothetical protein
VKAAILCCGRLLDVVPAKPSPVARCCATLRPVCSTGSRGLRSRSCRYTPDTSKLNSAVDLQRRRYPAGPIAQLSRRIQITKNGLADLSPPRAGAAAKDKGEEATIDAILLSLAALCTSLKCLFSLMFYPPLPGLFCLISATVCSPLPLLPSVARLSPSFACCFLFALLLIISFLLSISTLSSAFNSVSFAPFKILLLVTYHGKPPT